MMRGYYGFGPHMMGYGSFGIAGTIVSILFWVAVFFLIVMIVKALAGHSHETDEEERNEDTALQILRERYAKGEITKRQFTDMKKDLE